MSAPLQIPLIDVRPEALPPAEPKPVEIFLVAAYRNVGQYWKIHRDSSLTEHSTEESARKHASELSADWSHRCILRVKLP